MPFLNADDETLDAQALSRRQRKRLGEMLGVVLSSNPFYMKKFSGLRFNPEADPLSQLPLTTRAELQEDQAGHPPYGSDLSYPSDRYIRMHQTSSSSGGAPLRWLDTRESWSWFIRCWDILYRAADIRPADRFIFPFSFGPFIGFWAALESALASDHLCITAGGMTTAARLRLIFDHSITVICCTPTYALRMAEVAAGQGLDLTRSSVRALIVAGEPGGSIPTTRSRIEQAWGARVFDHTGMTEIGSCSFECVEAPGGVHVLETEFIPEVIDASTESPLPDGEVGELVLTNLGRWGSPLIRYRTGDQVCMLRHRCACGRWFARLDGGILGRTDEMFSIRGNNVFPASVEEIVRGFHEIGEFRIMVDRRSALTELRIEVELTAAESAENDAVLRRLEEEIQNRLHFRPKACLVPPGSLPRFETKSRRMAYMDS